MSLFVLNTQSPAQILMRKKAKCQELPPPFLLVQLSTGSNKIDYLTRQGNVEALEIATKDIDNIIQRMVLDFNENFSFCPVYYFYDTNLHYVLEKKFEGILLDNDLNRLNTLNLPEHDSNYFIVQYGRRNSNEEWNSNTLVVYDWQLKPLPYPVPETFYVRFYTRTNGDPKKYTYNSSKFELRYTPMAGAYHATLRKFYRTHRIKNTNQKSQSVK